MPSSNSIGGSTSTSIASDFLLTLKAQVPVFVQSVEEALIRDRNLDVSAYEADHVCWRTETWEEYEELVGSLKEYKDNKNKNGCCELLIESNIGGRPIATFSLHQGIIVPPRATASASMKRSSSRSIHVIEIPAPKEGSFYKRGLEHVEFVIGDCTTTTTTTTTSSTTVTDSNINNSLTPKNDDRHHSTLEDFMKRYPSIPWNIKAKEKKVNPDISLMVDLKKDFGKCSVKFHLMPLAEVIAYEKRHGMV